MGIHRTTVLGAVAVLALIAQPAAVHHASAPELGVQADDQPEASCELPADAPEAGDLTRDALQETIQDAERTVCEATGTADGLVEDARERADDIAANAG